MPGQSLAPSNPNTSGAGGSSSGSMTPPDPEVMQPMPVTAATLNSMAALDDKATLSPGDRISFRVIEDRDDPVPRVVTDTGEVDFPYVGRVKVQGMTCHQVAVKLKQLLEVDYYKRATVIVGLDVIASNAQVVPHNVCWVIGQVKSVGPQELSDAQPLTVSQVILRAGGFGDFADQRRVRLIHRGTATDSEGAPPADLTNSKAGEIVDVKSVYDGHLGNDPLVKPNDYIIVPKKAINF